MGIVLPSSGLILAIVSQGSRRLATKEDAKAYYCYMLVVGYVEATVLSSYDKIDLGWPKMLYSPFLGTPVSCLGFLQTL